MIFWAAHLMGLLPLVWLGFLRARGQTRDAAYWWIAGAFGISFVADSAARWWVHPDLVGNLYPISQAALIGAVLLDRTDAAKFVIALGLVGIAAVLWHGPLGVDVLLATVAYLSVAWIAYEYKALGLLRVSLLVYFGVGYLTWMWYAASPGWPSWLGYQCVRLVGLVVFCAACVRPGPRLTVARSLRAVFADDGL